MWCITRLQCTSASDERIHFLRVHRSRMFSLSRNCVQRAHSRNTREVMLNGIITLRIY